MRHLLIAALLALALLLPEQASAQVRRLGGAECGLLGISCAGDENVRDLEIRINYFTDAAILFVGVAATIFLVYAGFKFVTSAGSEESATQAKRQIIYAALGMIVAASAFVIRRAIEATYRGDPRGAAELLRPIAENFITFALALIGIIATIYLIYAGYRYISSRGEPDAAQAAKRQIAYAIVGLVLAGGAYLISDVFVTVTDPNIVRPGAEGASGQDLVDFIRWPINAILALVALAALAYIILAGVMYFSSQGDERQAEEAKRQLIYGIIGITVILLSAAIVNYIIFAVAP